MEKPSDTLTREEKRQIEKNWKKFRKEFGIDIGFEAYVMLLIRLKEQHRTV